MDSQPTWNGVERRHGRPADEHREHFGRLVLEWNAHVSQQADANVVPEPDAARSRTTNEIEQSGKPA